jgi:hypothetical protein
VIPPEKVPASRGAAAPAAPATSRILRPGPSTDAVGSSARTVGRVESAGGGRRDENTASQQSQHPSLVLALLGTTSLQELASFVERQRGGIGGAQLKLLWAQVTQLLPKRKRSWWLSRAEAELGGPLAPVCAHTISTLPKATPAVAAGLLHSLAHGGLTGPGPWAAVWTAAQASLAGGCAGLFPDDVARTAWALARAHGSVGVHPALLEELAAAGVAQHFELSGKDAATLAWAYVKLDHYAAGTAGARLLDVLVPVTTTRADGLAPFFLASAAWAFIQSGRATPELLDAIARGVAAARPSRFSPHDVAQLAWSFAKAWQQNEDAAAFPSGDEGHAGSLLLNESPEQAMERMFPSTPHALPAAPPPPPVFRVLGRVVKIRALHFSPSTVARTAWAFAAVGEPSPEVFQELSRATVGQLRDFNPQELATVAWAFASVGQPSPLMFTEVAARSIGGGPDRFSMQGLAMLAHAFAKARHRSIPLFDTIAPGMTSRMSEATPQCITMTVWAFVTAGVTAPALFDAAAAEAASRLETFQPLEIATTARSLAVAAPSSGVSSGMASFFVRLIRLMRKRLDEEDLPPHELSLLSRALVRAMEHPRLADAIYAAPPQAVSGATAGYAAGEGLVSVSRPVSVSPLECELGDSMASHVLTRLGQLKPYMLCRTAHTLASLGHSRASSYEALSRAASSQLHLLTVHDLATLAWAHAAAGQPAPDLFAAVGATAAKALSSVGGVEISQLALAFAAADFSHPSLFSPAFSERCASLQAKCALRPVDLAALHQWQLWRDETQRAGLEPRLAELCRVEFAQREAAASSGDGGSGEVAGAADEVAATLTSLGLPPQRDVRTAQGFTIGLLISLPNVGGSTAVAVELAPPRLFLCGDGKPRGGTALRWRQLSHFNKCEVLPLRTADWARLSPEARPAYLERRLADAFGHRNPEHPRPSGAAAPAGAHPALSSQPLFVG